MDQYAGCVVGVAAPRGQGDGRAQPVFEREHRSKEYGLAAKRIDQCGFIAFCSPLQHLLHGKVGERRPARIIDIAVSRLHFHLTRHLTDQRGHRFSSVAKAFLKPPDRVVAVDREQRKSGCIGTCDGDKCGMDGAGPSGRVDGDRQREGVVAARGENALHQFAVQAGGDRLVAATG